MQKYITDNKIEPNSFVQGSGWDNSFWENKNIPDKSILDKYFNDYLIVLQKNDGHAIWVNSKVLEKFNITKATPDPEGGQIFRNSNGDPTGILADKARALVVTPSPTEIEKKA